MLVGVIDRPKREVPVLSESRADLARQILKAASARRGVDVAMDRLSSGQYRGANFVIADHDSGWCVHAGDQVNCSELEDGLSIVGSCDVNDFRDERVSMANRLLTLQNLDSPIKFLAVASKVFARGPGIAGRPSMVVRGGEFGTVNSTLIALGKKPRDAIYQYAAGAPDQAKYEDYSPMLRDILSRGIRESRSSKATV
jgi:hypothetical protein